MKILKIRKVKRVDMDEEGVFNKYSKQFGTASVSPAHRGFAISVAGMSSMKAVSQVKVYIDEQERFLKDAKQAYEYAKKNEGQMTKEMMMAQKMGN